MKSKWNLSVIFKNTKEFDDECLKIKTMVKDLSKLEDNCFKNGKNLYNYLKEDTKVSELLDRLYSYASMNSDLDTSIANSEPFA